MARADVVAGAALDALGYAQRREFCRIARPGGDRPRVADALFVVEAVFDRHNKMQPRTAARNKAARCSLLVEFVY